MKRILDWIVFLLTGRGKIAEEAEAAGICNYSYGREDAEDGT